MIPSGDQAPGRELAQQATKERPFVITADHSKFKELQFTPEQLRTMRGPEVTKACLGCHNTAGEQFMKTIHWTWRDANVPPEQQVGKGGLTVNNFCVSLKSNWPRCTSCHAGYGWKDDSFDFNDQTRIDCLVCHEQTGTYKKFPTMSGFPAAYEADPADPGVQKGKVFPENGATYYAPDWNAVAQSVSRPTRNNCGTCHFFGGGGDGVKHGDLDSSMANPDKNLDVHMGSKQSEGQDFDCVRCHSTVAHHIDGRMYATPAATERKSLLENDLGSRIMCESCHSATPHQPGSKPNDHTDRVACQACHIPAFARVLPTKMRWDWSTAGQKKDGKPFKVKDEALHRPSYDSKKGDFVWKKDVEPEYYWFNGSMTGMTALDVIDPSREVRESWPVGDRSDPNARIMPFKIHRGKTPYDKVHNTMLVPHLFPLGPDDKTAYWKNWDWNAAFAEGQRMAGLKYSGEYDFVETAWAYPTTHMVAPKDQALPCEACHAKQGRLANLTGFYMPGRDASLALDTIGWGGLVAALIAVFIHAVARMVTRGRKEG
ncbi:MAG: tetrathionate reductase family octaheme c-type cytochrome [Desulfovibrionaceae bacterium]